MFMSRTSKRKSSNYASGDNRGESDFNEDIKDESDYDENFRLSYVDKVWLQKVLESKFEEEAKILFNNNSKKKRSVCLNGKESMECSVYQTYLQKELKCQNYLGEEDVDNFVCGKVDYNVALAKVTHFFIQPQTGEREMIVLPPNFSTLHGLDMIMASENRLRRTANFVDHSLPYVRYVTGFSGQLPKCIACSIKDCVHTPSGTCEKMVNEMKSSLLVVDEIMESAAMTETRAIDDKNLPCQCKALAKSKSQVDLLAKRFISMFLWPFLLNAVGISKEQEQLVYKKTPVRYDANFPNSKCGRPTKRKSTNSTNRSPKKKVKVEEPPVDEETHSNNMKVEPPMDQEPHSNKMKLEPTIDEETPSNIIKPTRRSTRSCVLKRKSYAKVVTDEDES